MELGPKMVGAAIRRPKTVTVLTIVITFILTLFILRVKVDTDPENMLSEDEAVRVFHHQVKEEFSLHDVVVLGVVNKTDKDGVFNPATLKNVYILTQFAKNLTDPKDPNKKVVTRYVIAPSEVDAIEQAGLGQVRFKWLMQSPPKTREQALEIRKNVLSNPLLKDTMASADGKALAIYLPISAKDFAFQVRRELLKKIETLTGNDEYYITGLPVAEDTFGVEMFKQMAISAPIALLAIFLLMLAFFRNIALVLAPMAVAMFTVHCTMGLLIGTGHTVHIMSSMIPIFLMPIAVVDSIHILSEFFDRYKASEGRRKTLEAVIKHLFAPMFYTSLTSAAGFASLALTPIPPVRVFGIFVAFGILLAWFLTIIFIPAYVMLVPKKYLANFGVLAKGDGETALSRLLSRLGGFTYSKAKLILVLSILALVISGYGISRITINDNPVKWFKKNHPIRVADRVLNHHFGGTYEAYLVLENAQKDFDKPQAAFAVTAELARISGPDQKSLLTKMNGLVADAEAKTKNVAEFFEALSLLWEEKLDAVDDDEYDSWADGQDGIEKVKNRRQIFKRPDMLNYIGKLQAHLSQLQVVGKSNAITDLVKKVYLELYEANPAYNRVPETINGVAQTLISFQNSHKPEDLWHLVNPAYTKANIWVQMKSGDNKDMEATVTDVENYFKNNPPPVPITFNWAGLTYLNVMWQNKMVNGMLNSFLSSFVVVFIMMALLFRSFLWGLLAMVPLSGTIALIYGVIGIIGKDYDMPVAVLSALTLGLAVDFAIHFLQRARETYKQSGTWQKALPVMFAEPARAITRNVIVIAVGFTPLLLAPLVPYQTVGIFLAAIMAVSGIATMLLLPALLTILQKWMFGKTGG
jgi:uncharacterized protein